jgi:hypothetical protein
MRPKDGTKSNGKERDKERERGERDDKRSTNVFKLQTGRLKIAGRRVSNEDAKYEKTEGTGSVASPRTEAEADNGADKYGSGWVRLWDWFLVWV